MLFALAGEINNPANSEGGSTTGVDFHRHLIRCAADALGLDLKGGANVVHGLLEDGKSVLLSFLGNDVEGTVNDALGKGLLAIEKDFVDQLRDQTVVVDCVRLNLTTDGCCTTRHVCSLVTVRASGISH